ncbi:MAG: hypothetical protein GWN16_04415, partial [Calditrichae bacterium]|nr:hypothetical protein [Calditrichia bacterium]
LPVTPYDAIHGIDLVAKYAVQEGHIDSRMFDDLKEHLSTQPYYAPFTALSQMIYRFSGHPFGKLWLSFMFLSLLIIFYVNIRQENHPIIAGLLTVMLIAIPELYAYTFLLQTDFSNAVFVSFSIIYAYHFIHEREMAYFWVSALLFGFGCWSRSETVSFAIIAALMLFLYLYFEESTKKPSPILYPAIFLGISFFFFAIWNLYYLPEVLNYTPESYFKFGFWDAERFATLWNGMMEILTTTVYWGYVFYIFLAVALVNLLFLRDRTNLFILLWIVLLFLGFLILLYHLQLNIKANINYTFRRGSFKLWIMMVYYIGTSALMMRLSSFVKKWEAN